VLTTIKVEDTQELGDIKDQEDMKEVQEDIKVAMGDMTALEDSKELVVDMKEDLENIKQAEVMKV
jgi:hypothetical protein